MVSSAAAAQLKFEPTVPFPSICNAISVPFSSSYFWRNAHILFANDSSAANSFLFKRVFISLSVWWGGCPPRLFYLRVQLKYFAASFTISISSSVSDTGITIAAKPNWRVLIERLLRWKVNAVAAAFVPKGKTQLKFVAIIFSFYPGTAPVRWIHSRTRIQR